MAESETPASSTSDPQPEAPAVPFEPTSRQKLGGKGCAWMAGIGCGVVILAGLALVAALAFNGDRLLAWSLKQFEQQILSAVPDGVDEAEQQALSRAFAAARERIRAGEVDPQALQRFQSMMFEMAFKPPGDRTAEDYTRLREALQELAEPKASAPKGEQPGAPSETPAKNQVQEIAGGVVLWPSSCGVTPRLT